MDELTQNAARIVRNPTWLAHRYDPQSDTVQFIQVCRAERARAVFLTDEYLRANDKPVVIERLQAANAAVAPASLHFIFHSAFCCSTLLAKAFDLPGVASTLKEPQILNDIVGWRHRSPVPGSQVSQILDHSLALLARPFEAGEVVIAKPSNVANGLADAMLAMRPAAMALLMYAPLPVYLRSVAKKGIDGRLWVRNLLVKLLREGLVSLGLDGEDYLALTDLQAAAVGWLAQQALFMRMISKYDRRVRALESETLVAQPKAAIDALSKLYGLKLGVQQVAEVAGGPAFTHHSKSGMTFGRMDRLNEYAAAAERHGDEIEKVLVWAHILAARAGVAMTLTNSLVSPDER